MGYLNRMKATIAGNLFSSINRSFEKKDKVAFLHKATDDSLKIKMQDLDNRRNEAVKFNMTLHDKSDYNIFKIVSGVKDKIYIIKPSLFQELGSSVKYKIMLQARGEWDDYFPIRDGNRKFILFLTGTGWDGK